MSYLSLWAKVLNYSTAGVEFNDSFVPELFLALEEGGEEQQTLIGLLESTGIGIPPKMQAEVRSVRAVYSHDYHTKSNLRHMNEKLGKEREPLMTSALTSNLASSVQSYGDRKVDGLSFKRR